MSTRTRIALFAATVWEVRAVRAGLPPGREKRLQGHRVFIGTAGAREYWLVQTGVGPVNAARTAAWLLQYVQVELAVSTGFACALVPAEVGGILAGWRVSSRGGEQAGGDVCDVPGGERDLCEEALRRHVPGIRFGRFLSVDRIAWRATDKQAYARASGAIALDMESAAIAIECRRTGVPFLAVRAVSDLLDEDLPVDFNLFLTPGGWAKGVATMLTTPSSVRGLLRLRRQSRLAAGRLTDCVRAYVEAVGARTAGRSSQQAATEQA